MMGILLFKSRPNGVKKKPSLLANKFWIFLIWGVLASAIGLALYKVKPSFIQGIDEIAGDARFKARGKVSPVKKVAVIAIDEKSINKLGRWPWPRTTIAKLVDGLAPAKVAAFDIVLSEPETKQRDSALGDSIKKS